MIYKNMGTRNFSNPKNADALYTIDYGIIDDDNEHHYDDYYDEYYHDYYYDYYREIEKGVLELFIDKMKNKYKSIGAKNYYGGKYYDKDIYYFEHGFLKIKMIIEYGYYEGAYIDFDILYDDNEIEFDNDGDAFYYDYDIQDDKYLNQKEMKKLKRLLKYANENLFEITNPMTCVGTFSNGEGVYKDLK